ncbi:DUF3108 domain-containing protein [Marinoscillum sp. MHG1-6]|uniref:DUF3108 domain-containing protein n=1 Tax=Marinoscillum sp. MHG1-6 TaxID=2959627 RepID=UPI002157FF33|nr:DUF3108 domain-containing protein [Marinoscillum sp. MHG1-6]
MSEINAQQVKYFRTGEKLEYSINYGWFRLGEAEAMVIDHRENQGGISQYSIELKARTVGFLSFIKNVEARYSSYLDTRTYKPVYSESQLLEGRDTWDQDNFFDYEKMIVDVRVRRNRADKRFSQRDVPLKENTYDILGTYMYLRNIDWGQLDVGDSLMLSTLYQKKIYDFGVESAGYETVTFEGEDYKAYKLYVLFPISTTFPKEKAVIFWVINRDGVHLPVMIEANMRIGRVTCELKGVSYPD